MSIARRHPFLMEAKILLRYDWYDTILKETRRDVTRTFNWIGELENFLLWEKEYAYQVGYILEVPPRWGNERVSNARLLIWYRDNGVEDELIFENFPAMRDYINKHPELVDILVSIKPGGRR